MLAWGFGDFKGGEIFPWRNYPLRNCPRAKFSPPLYVVLCILCTSCTVQGMSLDYMKVSLCDVFADGQAYVALSRARERQGLEIEDHSPGCVRANPVALAFLRGEAPEPWQEVATAQWAQVQRAASAAPLCPGHSQPCVRLQVKKDGPNRGRYFYKCAQRSQCSFFQWEE